jgi:hypothetical protein
VIAALPGEKKSVSHVKKAASLGKNIYSQDTSFIACPNCLILREIPVTELGPSSPGT